MIEKIECSRCKGTGKIDKPVESTIISKKCRACPVITDSPSVLKRWEQHDGLCIQCSSIPTGYDRIGKEQDICSYCNKEYRLH
jgi:hypothetical protein